MLLKIQEPSTPNKATQEPIVGIDLGTTNSAVAYVENKKPRVLFSQGEQATIPSVLAFGDDPAPLIGNAAKALLATHRNTTGGNTGGNTEGDTQGKTAGNTEGDTGDGTQGKTAGGTSGGIGKGAGDKTGKETGGKTAGGIGGEFEVIGSIKRLMGKAAEDLTSPLGFRLAKTAKGEIAKIATRHKDYTAVELSAFILRRLKQRAETVLKKTIAKAVITVPAYFDDAARLATKDAAKLAGLEVARLVNEPTAAALAYGLDKKRGTTVAVYDLGGGTFDVSILKLTKGIFRVLATGGDTQLGGDDLDQAVASVLWGNSLPQEPAQLATTLATVRRLREDLTTKDRSQIEVGGKSVTLSRAELEKIIAPIVDKTLTIAANVMEDVAEDITIDEVVMVGGATRTPYIQQAVGKLFNLTPKTDINPDEVVALGAGLQANALSGGGNGGGNLLLDVTPLSLGLETMGGIVAKIIDRNTPIPVSKAQEFTTQKDGQTALAIHVLQGEREMASQCRSLAKFELKDIVPMAAGLARIKITFTIDADGILNVTATELTTNKTQRVEVKPSYGISTTKMRQMLEESRTYAKQDIQQRLLAEARVEAQTILQQLDSALLKDGDLCSPDERLQMAKAIEGLEKVLGASDRHQIIQRREQLEKACQTFIERRINKALGSALKGKSVEQVEKDSG